MTVDTNPSSTLMARNAFEYHVSHLGAPRVRGFNGEHTDLARHLHLSFDDDPNWHPVFELAHTFGGEFEKGYTHNSSRGEHMSIPFWSEQDHFGILDVSFHKGDVFLSFADYPEAEGTAAYNAALSVLANQRGF